VLTTSEREVLATAARDPELGTIAGLLPQRAQDPELLLTAVREGMLDDEWLSRILAQQTWARSALAAAPESLQSHLGPEAASWVVREQGLADAAVRSWALALQQSLQQPGRAVTVTGRIAVETIEAAIRVAPELTDFWIASLTGQTDLSRRLTNVHFSLTSALLLALLNLDDGRGVEAFTRLLRPQAVFVIPTDPESDVPSLWFIPFRSRETAAARQAARLLFDQAFTDADLQRLSYAAALHGRLDTWVGWLEPVPTPDNTLAEARVLALLALAPRSEQAEAAITRFAATDAGWHAEVAAWARGQQQIDAWAQQWFRRFIDERNSKRAWAAFRLFLHCVDRRSLLWIRSTLRSAAESAPDKNRRRHLYLNWSQVIQKIRERTEEAGRHLCGYSVPLDLVPWKRGWRL